MSKIVKNEFPARMAALPKEGHGSGFLIRRELKPFKGVFKPLWRVFSLGNQAAENQFYHHVANFTPNPPKTIT
jgi:hypothetical protein